MSIKLVMLGDEGVGKTSLLSTCATGTFPVGYFPSIIDTFQKNLVVDEEEVEITMWDTAAGQDFDRWRPNSFENAKIFLLAFSIIDLESLEHIRTKWFMEIRQHMPNTPFIVIATKTDLREDKTTIDQLRERYARDPLAIAAGEELAREVGASDYVETSALAGEGVTTLLESVVRIVRASPSVDPPNRDQHGKKLSKCSLL